jgi:hypothetical protein
VALLDQGLRDFRMHDDGSLVRVRRLADTIYLDCGLIKIYLEIELAWS